MTHWQGCNETKTKQSNRCALVDNIRRPGIYQKADAVVLNKIDFLPHSDFNYDSFLKGIKLTNPSAPLFKVSGKTGEGVKELANWIVSNML